MRGQWVVGYIICDVVQGSPSLFTNWITEVQWHDVSWTRIGRVVQVLGMSQMGLVIYIASSEMRVFNAECSKQMPTDRKRLVHGLQIN